MYDTRIASNLLLMTGVPAGNDRECHSYKGSPEAGLHCGRQLPLSHWMAQRWVVRWASWGPLAADSLVH